MFRLPRRTARPARRRTPGRGRRARRCSTTRPPELARVALDADRGAGARCTSTLAPAPRPPARRTTSRLQQEYVATFDHTRKCALYLTYFAYGDTRRRGVALVDFKEAYRAAGVEWDEATGELPDHLCAVLAARRDRRRATPRGALLTDHRAGVEMLRLALTGWRNDDGTTGSPWLRALLALCATLPTLQGDEADAVRRLVEQGPPAEEVGLEGYGAGATPRSPAPRP